MRLWRFTWRIIKRILYVLVFISCIPFLFDIVIWVVTGESFVTTDLLEAWVKT